MAFHSAWHSAMFVPSIAEHQQELKQYLPKDPIATAVFLQTAFTLPKLYWCAYPIRLQEIRMTNVENKTKLLKIHSKCKAIVSYCTICIENIVEEIVRISKNTNLRIYKFI